MQHGVRDPSRGDRQAGLLKLAVEPVQVAAGERLQAQVTDVGHNPQPLTTELYLV